ncbi:MAG: hypothetical protein MR902_05890 [Campylobacter sp.]|nr:hypothetical protein [Campylobacter sp.]
MRKIIISLILLCVTAFADKMFVYNVKANLYDTNDKTKVVGEIYEGTLVQSLKTEGNMTLIKVVGEVSDTNSSTLAHKKDPLVTFLTLNNGDAKSGESYYVNSADLTSGEYASWEEVELAYYDTCSSCHAAHKPKEHLMNEWDAYLGAMQVFAKINDAEKDRILRFLQAYARDGIATEEE